MLQRKTNLDDLVKKAAAAKRELKEARRNACQDDMLARVEAIETRRSFEMGIEQSMFAHSYLRGVNAIAI